MCRDVFRIRPLELDEMLAMHEFLRTHGINPADVPAHTVIVHDHVSDRYVVETYARDPHTHRFVIEYDTDGHRIPKVELVSVDARTPFPL
jgi:hypothetical protein